MARPRETFPKYCLRLALERAGVKILGQETGLINAHYSTPNYPYIVQLPGPEEQRGVIYWKSYMRFPKNKAADARRKQEIMELDIPSLEMRPGPVDWMWITIERWMLTWRTQRHQYAQINSTKIGKMNKIKNRSAL